VLHAHRYLDVPDASELNKAVNKLAAKALAMAMSKKREDRPLSASEFSADLEAFFGSAERVDPAVAFAFLDELREDPDDKKERFRASKTTRAPTMPLMKAVSDRPRISGGAPLPPKTRSSSEIPVEKLPAGRTSTSGEIPAVKAPVRSTTSGEVPMAKSMDVMLVGSGSGLVEITANERVRADPNDTQAGAEEQAPNETNAEKSGDTRDEVEEHSGRTDPEKSDPGATMTEIGELRVITTLKGLTTTAVLMVDGKKQGNTPASLQVPAGRHTVRVERQGYKAVEKPAQVTANQVTLVRVELGPGK
jgi:hypothetical protein